MAQIVHHPQSIAPGEACLIVYIDRMPDGMGGIVGTIERNVRGPIAREQLAPRKLTGFDHPAQEAVSLARRYAAENGIGKILIVDPSGWLPHAKLNRYRDA